MGKRFQILMFFFIVFIASFFLSILSFAQIRETGIIHGTAEDEQGAALPGVTVTVSGPHLIGGAKIYITDQKGYYRFTSLPPGPYTVSAELPGFVKVVREVVQLHANLTLTADFKMAQAKLKEEVVVIARTPTVDVTSSSLGQTVMSTELLMSIPLAKDFGSLIGIATGVQSTTLSTTYLPSYGLGSGENNSYQFDGIDVASARFGNIGFSPDSNIIQETAISALGLPAEFGNYTGVVLSGISKSGSNKVSILDEFWYNGRRWNSQNLGNIPAEQFFFPNDKTKKFEAGSYLDAGLQVGGRFLRDKLWFFVSGEYRRTNQYPLATTVVKTGSTPKAFGKLTYQMTGSTKLNFSVSFDNKIIKNAKAGAYYSPEADRDHAAPGWFFNTNLTSVLSPNSVFELKLGYNQKHDNQEPKSGHDISGHYDIATNRTTVNNMYWAYDRDRVIDCSAHLSHYFPELLIGSHDAKIGAQFKYSAPNYTVGYTGGGDMYYDYNGEPFLRVIAKPDYFALNHYFTNFDIFAQDRWTLTNRLTLNLGLRYDFLVYRIPGVGDLFHQNNISPRLGFAYDLLGDRKNVIKFHYGHYYDKVYETAFLFIDKRFVSFDYYFWNSQDWDYLYSENSANPNLFKVDPNLKRPYIREISGGYERELFRDASLSVNIYYRTIARFLGYINTLGRWKKVTVTNPGFDGIVGTSDDMGTIDVYERLNLGEAENVLTNPRKGQCQAMIDDPKFSAKGFEIIFQKRYSHRWQMIATYHYTKATGNSNNTFQESIGYDPNYFVNAYGQQGFLYGQPHQFKLQGTVLLPLDIELGFLAQVTSGYPKDAKFSQYLGFEMKYYSIAPPGTYKYATRKDIDLRVQKHFNVWKGKLSLMADIFNILNSNTVLQIWPYVGPDYNKLLYITQPRTFSVGIRFIY